LLLDNGAAQQFLQHVVRAEPVAAGLAKTFRVFHPGLASARSAPGLEHLNVFVDAMLAAKPVALAGMATEHLDFAIDDRRDVDEETGRDEPAIVVDRADAIAEIEVRGTSEWRRGIGSAGCVVRHWPDEACVAREETGDLVVGHVILSRVSENDVGARAA